MKKVFAIALFVISVSLVISGCGSSEEPVVDTPVTGKAPTAKTTDASTETADAGATAAP